MHNQHNLSYTSENLYLPTAKTIIEIIELYVKMSRICHSYNNVSATVPLADINRLTSLESTLSPGFVFENK